ncbi:MAG: hypothetical protein ACRENI_02190 [Gemmatimonadaceae bacterium]
MGKRVDELRSVALTLVIVVLAACGDAAADRELSDSLTQRQRDSTIGASRIPGARGVQGALRASDSAAARAARLDSAARVP